MSVSHDTFFTWSLTEGWQPFPDPLPEDVEITPWLQDQGYASTSYQLMRFVPGGYELWTHTTETQPHRYVVLLELPDASSAVVFLVSVPTLMDYLRLYARPALAAALMVQGNDVTQVLEKAFQAWHGHSPLDICDDCDPDGMKAERSRQQSNRGKAAKELQS
jgi:hypothetical protein